MIKANNPSLKSWVEVPADSDFPIQNLPFGVFRTASNPRPRICSRIGDFIVDLVKLDQMSLLEDCDIPHSVLDNAYLNDLMALGKEQTRALRNCLSDILKAGNKDAEENAWHFLHDAEKAEMLMPVRVGDYTDFYSSIEHATNVGTMFRDPDNALLPNWKHLPVGYHGRASSIVVSGTEIKRPQGQTKPDADKPPVFGPSRLLDFELEMGFVIGKENQLGQPVSTAEAEDHIFGLMLFNDWSARDIQKWEYVPLGPFLAKNFASTVSPWVVTLDALEPFRVAGPEQDPKVLPYLEYKGKKNYDINLQVAIRPEGAEETVVCNSNYKYMYWNMTQQLAHHTVTGCNLRSGDLLASGTISGPTEDSYGSMLEISWRGTKPVAMNGGGERKFINDGDSVILRGWAEKDGVRIGFGEAAGKILPAG